MEIVLNELLEVQFSEQFGPAPYERSPERLGYRAELLLVGRDSPPSTGFALGCIPAAARAVRPGRQRCTGLTDHDLVRTTFSAFVSAARPNVSYASSNSSSVKWCVTNCVVSSWRLATSRSSVGVE